MVESRVLVRLAVAGALDIAGGSGPLMCATQSRRLEMLTRRVAGGSGSCRKGVACSGMTMGICRGRITIGTCAGVRGVRGGEGVTEDDGDVVNDGKAMARGVGTGRREHGRSRVSISCTRGAKQGYATRWADCRLVCSSSSFSSFQKRSSFKGRGRHESDWFEAGAG